MEGTAAMNSFRIDYLFLAICTLSLVSCSDDSGGGSLANYNKPVSEFLTTFNTEGAAMDVAAVSTEAQAKMLDCDVPSTEQRQSGDSLSVTYKLVNRSRQALDSHLMISDEEKGYSTDSKGAVFKRTYTLNQLMVDGNSALTSGVLSYRDTCTSSGCDRKQREYLAGSAAYLIDVDSTFRHLIRMADLQGRKICRFHTTGATPKKLIDWGNLTLGGVQYKALRISAVEDGEVYCETDEIDRDGSAGSIFMGPGQQTDVKVVVADTIPQLHNEFVTFDTYTGQGKTCHRSIVGISKNVTGNGTVYSGDTKEIVSVTVGGTILSVDDYNKVHSDKELLIQQLHNAVTLASSEKSEADYQLLDATAKAQEAQAHANTTYATDADLRELARLQNDVLTKRDLAAQAALRLSDAREALARAEAGLNAQ
jgi:hypothetical protein